MEKIRPIYEGKAKIIYETNDPSLVIVEFKDDVTAFDGKKKGTIQGKGEVCNAISAKAFEFLSTHGIKTHFVSRLGPQDMLVRRLRILPVEAVVRNIVAGSLAKRLGLAEGEALGQPVFETYYKSDALGDPLVNNYHLAALKAATLEQIAVLEDLSLKINEYLLRFFEAARLLLVDFKLEFGVPYDSPEGESNMILLADEISPDTCRLWDIDSHDRLDKDRFRRDMGNVELAYQEVMRRVESAHGMAR
ncbi:MAG TPA: phosphoribosylaminoimidazolesuccinocarboxamide synthase [Firmicutes bacterium]|nr:phosphoribosylaminoimidazolesuccinocarboxamide synthase [Bacillota bacterium]HHY97833.1 phosphoribosylaminoimidazolesuccinocarboxamide synthase [Bacillota bacterium]